MTTPFGNSFNDPLQSRQSSWRTKATTGAALVILGYVCLAFLFGCRSLPMVRVNPSANVANDHATPTQQLQDNRRDDKSQRTEIHIHPPTDGDRSLLVEPVTISPPLQNEPPQGWVVRPAPRPPSSDLIHRERGLPRSPAASDIQPLPPDPTPVTAEPLSHPDPSPGESPNTSVGPASGGQPANNSGGQPATNPGGQPAATPNPLWPPPNGWPAFPTPAPVPDAADSTDVSNADGGFVDWVMSHPILSTLGGSSPVLALALTYYRQQIGETFKPAKLRALVASLRQRLRRKDA